MKKKVLDNQNAVTTEKKEGVSRRSFLTGAGGIGAAAAVAATTGMLGSRALGKTSDAPCAERVTEELPIPADAAAPKTTEYQCDVLVIGGGFAGLNAAVAAGKAGRSVLLVDKGRPGYSGLSPFVSSHRWFDPDFGDDAQAFRDCIMRGSDYIANMDWFEVWITDSKETYQRLMDWEILTQYPKASKAGDYAKNEDFPGYREKFATNDRRTKFIKVLKDNGIAYIDHTMITDVIEEDGKVVGAMGFDVPSAAVVTIHARAVVMCTGGGSYKPSGFPTGGDTFDGEYIGYHLGLPIVGKEFDDFHQTLSYAAGNSFPNNSWTYLENIWLCGGDISAENAAQYATIKARIMVLGRVKSALSGLGNNDGTDIEDLSKASAGRRGGTLSKNPNDPRTGKDNDSMPKGDIYGAAVGMCSHLSSGIFCGLDDLVGDTGFPGLYVAGDGSNGSVATGAAYPNGVGFTSSFCATQGWRAGKAAAKYAGGAETAKIPADKASSTAKEIRAPLSLKKGLDPNWARDVLQAVMAPYWIHIVKSEQTLSGALAQIEYMRDEVVPKLMAASAHDLRLCHEMKHKVLSAEMKLRAGLERKESRGLHYRADYPYRDDQNFLAYMTVRKGKDGSMTVSKVDIKDEWKGDLSEDYTKRYGWRFPGETEAKGLPPEKETQGWHK